MGHPKFAAIIAQARATEGMTAAEMDYSLSVGDGKARAAMANAAYWIANEHTPSSTASAPDREERARALNLAIQDDVDAMTEAARGKKYVNWSNVSRSMGRRIQYAR